MITGILKEYKSLYNTYCEIGSAYNSKNLYEQDKSNYFDKKLWDHLSENGIHGLVADKKYGGSGFSALKTAVAFEALAFGCENNGMVFSSIAHLIACVTSVSFYGSDVQKDKYLSKMAGGKWISANAITEIDSGSDVYHMSAFAAKIGNEYCINGQKNYVTNAPISDIIILYVLTDKAKGFFGGVSCFIVKTDRKGILLSDAIDKMGLNTAQMGTVTVSDLMVGAEDMIGKPGAGAVIFSDSMIWERVVVSAFLIGQLERLFVKINSYTKNRKLVNKTLNELQYIRHNLADIKTIIQAGKNMVYDAAYAIDNKHKDVLSKSSMVKLFVSENVVNSIKQLQVMQGALGYLRETGIEREYRDSYAALIYSGTSAIQKNIISSDL